MAVVLLLEQVIFVHIVTMPSGRVEKLSLSYLFLQMNEFSRQ